MKWKLLGMMLGLGLWVSGPVVAEEPPPADERVLVLDHMDNVAKNDVGGRNSVYLQAPSRAGFSKAGDYGRGDGNSGLKIVYDKKNEGGPRGDGGFCGYYSIVKRGPDSYLDASGYKYFTFWVKGAKGDEKFKVGVADKMYEAMDDSVKSQEIGAYLPAGKITTDWQLAVIPVEEFFIDWKQMHAYSICFEADVFDNGAGQGTVFIDEINLSKEKPTTEAPTADAAPPSKPKP